MLRIFATSKLYRLEKSPDYYENIAITATEKNKESIRPKETVIKKPQNFPTDGKGKGG